MSLLSVIVMMFLAIGGSEGENEADKRAYCRPHHVSADCQYRLNRSRWISYRYRVLYVEYKMIWLLLGIMEMSDTDLQKALDEVKGESNE